MTRLTKKRGENLMHHEQKNVGEMTKLLFFYGFLIWFFGYLFRIYLWEKTFLHEIIIFELGCMIFYLLQNGFKYAVNYLEFITLSNFSKKNQLILLSDLMIHILKIVFQLTCLIRFAIYYNYPVFWARDIFLSMMMSVDYVKKYVASLRMIRDMKKLPTVDLRDYKDDCGICLHHMVEGTKLSCGHYFHKECLL